MQECLDLVAKDDGVSCSPECAADVSRAQVEAAVGVADDAGELIGAGIGFGDVRWDAPVESLLAAPDNASDF